MKNCNPLVQVRLRHVQTGVYLASSNQKYQRPISGQQEIFGRSKQDFWAATEGVYFPARTEWRWLADFAALLRLMDSIEICMQPCWKLSICCTLLKEPSLTFNLSNACAELGTSCTNIYVSMLKWQTSASCGVTQGTSCTTRIWYSHLFAIYLALLDSYRKILTHAFSTCRRERHILAAAKQDLSMLHICNTR